MLFIPKKIMNFPENQNGSLTLAYELMLNPPDASTEIRNCIQKNGTKIYRQSHDPDQRIPSPKCELFISKIPKQWTEYDILPHLKRFGEIFEFRLMMDFDSSNRGFGYVRYTTKHSATVALTILNHFYVEPRKTLNVRRSFDKCRLFIGNIPKSLTRNVIQYYFQQIFPEMKHLIIYKHNTDVFNNPGYAFVDFDSHQAANQAKMELAGLNNCCVGWGQPLKIMWAHQKKAPNKTLFLSKIKWNTESLMRFIEQIVNRREIMKLTRMEEFVFVEFYDKKVAVVVEEKLKEIQFDGCDINVTWARPNYQVFLSQLQETNFYPIFYLKCLANYWDLPVFIFGRILNSVQYVAVYTKTGQGITCAFFMEIFVNVTDIWARISEVLIKLIDEYGNLPSENYVIRIHKHFFQIVASITDLHSIIIEQNDSKTIPIYWHEIAHLCKVVSILSNKPRLELYTSYIKARQVSKFLENLIINGRILGCLSNNERIENEFLILGLQIPEMSFVSCDFYSKNNFEYLGNDICLFDLHFSSGCTDKKSQIYHLNSSSKGINDNQAIIALSNNHMPSED